MAAHHRLGAASAFAVCVVVSLAAIQPAGAAAAAPAKAPASTACVPKPDRVKVTAFTLAPAAPKRCGGSTITMKIENVSGCELAAVPWQIAQGGAVLGSGAREHLGAGQSFTVTAALKDLKAGKHHVYGDADTSNSLKEWAAHRANNLATPVDLEISSDPLPEVKAMADKQRAGASALRDALPPAPSRTASPQVLEAYSNVARFTEASAARAEAEAARFETMCPSEATTARNAFYASVEEDQRKLARAYDTLSPLMKGMHEAQSQALHSMK
jgi:hypothetical protein